MSKTEVKQEVKQARERRRREPLEVLVQCRWTGNWIHAEYRREVSREGSIPRYKVYSPFFVSLDRYYETTPADAAKAYRWVPTMRIRGLAPEEVEEFLKKDALEAALDDLITSERLEFDYPNGSIGPLVKRFPQRRVAA